MIETFTIISGIISFLSIFFKWDKNLKQFIFWCFIIALIIFYGLRWETGTDWQNYRDSFDTALDKNTPGFETGFRYYNWIIRSLTDNYSVYLLITSTIIFIGIFYTIFRITNYSFISVFFLTGYIPWYAGTLRQMIAIVCFVLALKYIWHRKLLKFLLLMYLGILFHTTLLPFTLIYWMYGASLFTFVFFGVILILGSSIVAFFVAQVDFLISLATGGHGIENSIDGTLANSSPVLGLSRKILTISLNFFFLKYATKNILSEDEQDIKKIYFFLYFSSYSLAFYIVGTFFINYFSSRLDIYPGIIGLAVYLGLVEKHIKSRKRMLYLFLFVCFLVAIFYSRLEYMDLFHPYKSIFYNVDYKRDLH